MGLCRKFLLFMIAKLMLEHRFFRFNKNENYKDLLNVYNEKTNPMGTLTLRWTIS